MEKIPVTDPKAGKPTPLPVKGVDVPEEADANAGQTADVPTPPGYENAQDFAENEGLVAKRLRDADSKPDV